MGWSPSTPKIFCQVRATVQSEHRGPIGNGGGDREPVLSIALTLFDVEVQSVSGRQYTPGRSCLSRMCPVGISKQNQCRSEATRGRQRLSAALGWVINPGCFRPCRR